VIHDYDGLIAKIKSLSESLWERKATQPTINEWLENFADVQDGHTSARQLHALYLLSHFMYFGAREMRELMRVLFRDLYRYPIIEQLRNNNGHSTDTLLLNSRFQEELDNTLFLGIGNPSESGSHLLYYFRQENGLPKSLFVHTHELLVRSPRGAVDRFLNWLSRGYWRGKMSLRHPSVTRYVFIDDFCGSGHQAQEYSSQIVEDIKALSPTSEVSYFVLCATSEGLEAVRDNTLFDVVRCVFELDTSFRCFSSNSRYFPAPQPWSAIAGDVAEEMCVSYGSRLVPDAPLGYGDCQLLLGFHHNTPDNTLPIFWAGEDPLGPPWKPMFKRYPKLYA